MKEYSLSTTVLRSDPSSLIRWMLPKVHSDGSRLVQALGDHHIAEGAVQSGHLDHIKALSTAMPSTLPMPLVTTSSLQVWSLLALLMVLRPMSTQ
ncbi:hypothetical protein EYF80_008392 [Liparis tanakae]|uniref:Uncharacterized protein n=1 Tax=Liparis tanakae TaxID=230148 RepID=A0A4Z2IU19_9TELE|nr:hypothetical protein EYF80_008392 [Liparis tanakae]